MRHLTVLALSGLILCLPGCKQKPAGQQGQGGSAGTMKPAAETMGPMTGAKRPGLQPVPRPATTRPVPKGLMARKEAMALAKKFIGLLRAGKWKEARALYAPKLRKTFKEAQLKELWEKLLHQFGTFEKLDQGVWILPKGELAFVFMPAWFQKGKFDLIVPIQGKQGVAGIRARFHEHHGEFPAPPYADQSKLTEQKVTVGEGTAWALPGTLTTPKVGAPYPVVVVVHGSGPQDRDLTFGPNKIYRDLAWGLASRGIAVLRYDKRTRVHAQRMLKLKEKITHVQEYVDDALAAVKMLAGNKDISRIFVLGHSDGAYTVPAILKRATAADYGSRVAGGILLAGPSRQLYENYLEQIRFLAKVRKVDKDPAVVKQIAALHKAIQKVKDPNLSPATPNRELPLGASAQYWLARRAYKHKAVAKALSQPLLVLNGGRDYQVTTTDFNGWKRALQGKANAFFRLYPALNHFFIAGKGAPNPREYYNPGHLDLKVIGDLEHFVKKLRLK